MPEEVLPPDWLDGYATARVWEARKRGRAIRSFLEHEEKAVMTKVRYNLERTSFLDEVSLAGNATGGDRMQSRGRLERKLSAFFFLMGALADNSNWVHQDKLTRHVEAFTSINMRLLAKYGQSLVEPLNENPRLSLEYLKHHSSPHPVALYAVACHVVRYAPCFDTDRDGILTAAEACVACLLVIEILYGDRTSEEDSMSTLFALIDDDGDGRLSTEEIRTFIRKGALNLHGDRRCAFLAECYVHPAGCVHCCEQVCASVRVRSTQSSKRISGSPGR